MTDLLANAVPVDVEKPADDDVRMWSVTTIIGALDKPALLYWAAEQTAEAACAVAKSLPSRIEEEGHEAVVKWLRDARFRKPKNVRSATELGTAVHDAVERYAITGERPEVDDEVRPFLDRFTEWAQKAQPAYHAAELTVYSPQYGYAGTLDAIATIQGQRVLLDYKSSRKSVDAQGKPTGPYSTVALQIASYRYAEFAAVWRPRRYTSWKRRYYLLGPDEREMAVPVPEVDGGVVLHLTPEHADCYPVKCDESVWTAFLYVLEAARWKFETSKSVIGDPLVFPEVAA